MAKKTPESLLSSDAFRSVLDMNTLSGFRHGSLHVPGESLPFSLGLLHARDDGFFNQFA
jgi:hypothetical protein